MTNNKRRDFLKTTLKSTLAITIGKSAMGPFIEPYSSSKKIFASPPQTGFDQQPLPYAYNSLEDIIDATTMELHYSKHAAAYSKNLKEAVAAEGADSKKSVEDILSEVSKYTPKMRNNAGGHYNHEMFWQCMRPKVTDNKPGGNFACCNRKELHSMILKQSFLLKVKTGLAADGHGCMLIKIKCLKLVPHQTRIIR